LRSGARRLPVSNLRGHLRQASANA
jgi:hypothetical protein